MDQKLQWVLTLGGLAALFGGINHFRVKAEVTANVGEAGCPANQVHDAQGMCTDGGGGGSV